MGRPDYGGVGLSAGPQSDATRCRTSAYPRFTTLSLQGRDRSHIMESAPHFFVLSPGRPSGQAGSGKTEIVRILVKLPKPVPARIAARSELVKEPEIDEDVRRVRDKLHSKQGVQPLDKSISKKERRRRQREALRKQVLKYCDDDGYIRTPIPNELFVQCLRWHLLRKETRDTPCPRGFPEWWFIRLKGSSSA